MKSSADPTGYEVSLRTKDNAVEAMGEMGGGGGIRRYKLER